MLLSEPGGPLLLLTSISTALLGSYVTCELKRVLLGPVREVLKIALMLISWLLLRCLCDMCAWPFLWALIVRARHMSWPPVKLGRGSMLTSLFRLKVSILGMFVMGLGSRVLLWTTCRWLGCLAISTALLGSYVTVYGRLRFESILAWCVLAVIGMLLTEMQEGLLVVCMDVRGVSVRVRFVVRVEMMSGWTTGGLRTGKDLLAHAVMADVVRWSVDGSCVAVVRWVSGGFVHDRGSDDWYVERVLYYELIY